MVLLEFAEKENKVQKTMTTFMLRLSNACLLFETASHVHLSSVNTF